MIYESYIDKNQGIQPSLLEKINTEGGILKIKKAFNQSANKITVKDYKNKSEKACYSKTLKIYLSAFYLFKELTY
jgi:hypothetical protein